VKTFLWMILTVQPFRSRLASRQEFVELLHGPIVCGTEIGHEVAKESFRSAHSIRKAQCKIVFQG